MEGIPDELDERIMAVVERGHYPNRSEFVRDAIRRRVDEIEACRRDTPIGRTHFSYEYSVLDDRYTIELQPKTESPLNISQAPEFRYEGDVIDQAQIESALDNVTGVAKAWFTTSGALNVQLSRPLEMPATDIARSVFKALYDAINDETDGRFRRDSEEDLRAAINEYAENEQSEEQTREGGHGKGQSENTQSEDFGPFGNHTITGWKYSISKPELELYTCNEINKLILLQERNQDESTKYVVEMAEDGRTIREKTHHRYGDAKREVKRWILELSNQPNQ